VEAAGTSVCLMMEAVLLSARWAGRSRRPGLEQAAKASGDVPEVQGANVVLRDTIEFLIERLACVERRLKANIGKPYSPTDHFSRRVVAAWPLEGPNAAWIVEVLERAFSQHGNPRHIITDQEGIFTCDLFRDLLRQWKVNQRFGAVGKSGSIAVTERVIRTMKGEWLRRAPVIKGLDHLGALLADFTCYHNSWRPHMTLEGAVPELIHAGQHWRKPPRTAKTVPARIERRFFPETRVAAFRLPEAA